MSSIKTDFAVEKLRGAENFHNWIFAMENLLEFKGLKKCIEVDDDGSVAEKDAEKLAKAKTTLVLSVDSSLYVHIRSAKTALQIWKIFSDMYEDKGILGTVGLLMKFVSTRLSAFENMQTYLDEIISIGNKLERIGISMPDQLLAAFMLAGLTEEYKPFILGLQGNIGNISTSSVKMRLLDCQLGIFEKVNSNALLANKSEKKKYQRSYRCYSCGGKNHKSSECMTKPKNNENAKEKDKEKAGTSKKKAFTCFTSSTSQFLSKEWIIDSGASYHMTPYDAFVAEKKKSNVSEILAANNSTMMVKGTGKSRVTLNKEEIEINNVLHVPELAGNLLSIYQIVKKGNKVIFDKDFCSIYGPDEDLIIQCKPVNGTYKLKNEVPNATCMLSKAEANSAFTWHRRFGHINYNSLCKMRDGAVTGMKFPNANIGLSNCKICAKGKQSRLPFERSKRKTKQVLDLIHSDLVEMEKLSIGGARYLLTFVDDFSKKLFIYFLKNKSDVFESFVEFKAYVENQTEKKIKIFRTDNGLEYLSKEFTKFCKSNGIQHQRTCIHTPQQNGVAERMNRTIEEKARCMLFDAKLEKPYWAEACNMAAYLINRSVCSTWKNKTPEEIWSGDKVDVSNLHIFGSPIMVHIPKEKRKKMCAKSSEMLFMGYDADTKGYRCFDKKAKKISISRDVIFHEQHFAPQVINFQEESLSVGDSPDVLDENNSMNEISEDEAMEWTEVSSMDEDSFEMDYEVNDENEVEVRRSSRVSRPVERYGYLALLSKCIESDDLPKSAADAMKGENCEKWKKAMIDELNSMKENDVWDLVERPVKCKTLKAKWVFALKRNQEGEIIRYKARFVAKGYNQREGIDFNETYAPVIRQSSLRFLMALAVQNDLKIDQMDVTTAYLHGDLEEEIYIEQPEGFNDESNRVCRLKKSLYGLKQSGRQWNFKLDDTLKSFGLIKSKMDPCIYFNENLDLIIAIYVDDLLIFWKNASVLDHIKKALNTSFKMKDLGTAKCCLGINIKQSNGKIELDQKNYINKVLERFNMKDCKPISTPSDLNQKLSMNSKDDSEAHDESKQRIPYQEAVGSLLYLAQCTRPDISFAVNDVSRFNSNFNLVHWKAVKRIMRYLKGSIDFKLIYEKGENDELHGYCDADWASDIDKRRSCTGYIFRMSRGAITWSSKRQQTIALSTTEAEYMAMASAVQEALWVRQLANELQGRTMANINLFCDNQGAIKLAESDAFRPRTKHIDIRHHFIRNYVEKGIINVKYVSTQEMVADSLTKAVPKDKHNFCSKSMGLC